MGSPAPATSFTAGSTAQAAYNPQPCEKVTLAMDEDGSFAACPKGDELVKFDPCDRKFVAAARTHPAAPPVVNACGKDWPEHHEALSRHGGVVELLCPGEMTRPRNG